MANTPRYVLVEVNADITAHGIKVLLINHVSHELIRTADVTDLMTETATRTDGLTPRLDGWAVLS